MARDDDEQRAMTSERLAAIRKRWSERDYGQLDVSGRYRNADWAGTWNYWIMNAPTDEGELLAEVERLRAREAALVAEREQTMAIVRSVAYQDCAQDIDDPEWMQCLACGGGGPAGDLIEHHASCYYVAARALLASADGLARAALRHLAGH